MTSRFALAVALSYIMNDLMLFHKGKSLQEDGFPSNVFLLMSICVVLRRIDVMPICLRTHLLSAFLEIPLATFLLETSFAAIWDLGRHYLIEKSEVALTTMCEDHRSESPICFFCCGKKDCAEVLVNMLLRGVTGVLFVVVCYATDRREKTEPCICECVSQVKRVEREAGNRIERTASKRWRGSVRRVVSAAIYNLSCFAHGCSTGWVSGALGERALGGGAWLAALPCLVALPAAPFFAVLADARGRKPGAAAVCFSFIISWSLAAWCGTRGVWAARVAAGAGGAGALALAPVYCAEIAPRTRGLAAMPALACSCGILYAYAAGGVLSPYALSLSMAVPPTVLLVSLLWLPETPSFLISIGRIQDAAKVMCWFDGSDFREDLTEVIEQQEVRIRTSECHGSRRRELYRQDSDAFQPMLKRSSGLESNSDSRKAEPSAFRELFRHRRTRRALVSCCILLMVSAGSGVGAVTSFAASVLRYTARGASVNHTAYNVTLYNRTLPRKGLFETSEAASLLCGTCLVLGAAVATITVDKFGRKMLLIWSCSGIACCLALLGAYCDPRLRTYSWSHMHRLWSYKTKLHHNLNNSHLVAKTGLNPEVWANSTKWVVGNGSLGESVGAKIYSDNIDRSKWDIQYNGTTLYDVNGGTFFSEKNSMSNTTVDGTKYNVTDGLWRRKEMEMANRYWRERETIWPPVILLSVVLFLYNIGLGSVPFVLMSEMFSINVRSLASSFLISWMWLSCFLVLRYFGTVTISLGLYDTYYICSSVTLLGSIYIFLFIPETRGKSQKQIDDDLEGPLLVGLRRKRKSREDA